jgi:hypothetical protein
MPCQSAEKWRLASLLFSAMRRYLGTKQKPQNPAIGQPQPTVVLFGHFRRNAGSATSHPFGRHYLGVHAVKGVHALFLRHAEAPARITAGAQVFLNRLTDRNILDLYLMAEFD